MMDDMEVDEDERVEDLLELFYQLTGIDDNRREILKRDVTPVQTYLLVDTEDGFFEIVLMETDANDHMGRPSLSIKPVNHPWRLLRQGKEPLDIFYPNRWKTRESAVAQLEHHLGATGEDPGMWAVQAVLPEEGEALDGEFQYEG